MMGQLGSKYTASHLWKEDEPDCQEPIKYDPFFGYEKPELREKIVVPATKEEMDSANIAMEHRDECVDKRIALMGCVKRYRPFTFYCKGLREEVRDCYFDAYINDMKEFERERRLNIRERRIREKLMAS